MKFFRVTEYEGPASFLALLPIVFIHRDRYHNLALRFFPLALLFRCANCILISVKLATTTTNAPRDKKYTTHKTKSNKYFHHKLNPNPALIAICFLSSI